MKDVMRVHKSLGLKIKGAVHVTGGAASTTTSRGASRMALGLP